MQARQEKLNNNSYEKKAIKVFFPKLFLGYFQIF